jgi:predicted transcriptional regulator
MAESLTDELNREVTCEGVFECLFGLGGVDRACFEHLLVADRPQTVDQLALAVDRDRTTAYRAVNRLVRFGLVRKEKEGAADGGYRHRYAVREPNVVATHLQNRLNDVYAELDVRIDAFRETFGEADAPSN